MCKTEEDEGPSTEEDSQSFHGVGVCKWFNVRMGFGFLAMSNREGVPLDEPVDVFVHQVGLLSGWGQKLKLSTRWRTSISVSSKRECVGKSENIAWATCAKSSELS